MLTSVPAQSMQQPLPPPNVQQIPVQMTSLNKEVAPENNSLETTAEKMRSAKKSEDNPNKCPICLKIFLNATKKNRHMKIHSKTDMPYKCSVCNKEFMHGGNYKIHMRMHNNERPFKCTMCPKGFVQAQDLDKHTRTHTGKGKYEKFHYYSLFSFIIIIISLRRVISFFPIADLMHAESFRITQ